MKYLNIFNKGCSSDEGSAYVRLLRQMSIASSETELDGGEDHEIFVGPNEVSDLDYIDNDEDPEVEYESALEEDNIILTIHQYTKEFNAHSLEVYQHFDNIEYDHVVEVGPSVPVNQDIDDLDFNEEEEYDFSRPDQDESQLVRDIGVNVSRYNSTYLSDLTIELGN